MALPQFLDPELRRRVEIAADRSGTSVNTWIEQVLRRELEREKDDAREDEEIFERPPGVKPRGSRHPIKLRGGKSMAATVMEERDAMYLPPPGSKPKGSMNPPRLEDGSKISDAVIEDRR